MLFRSEGPKVTTRDAKPSGKYHPSFPILIYPSHYSEAQKQSTSRPVVDLDPDSNDLEEGEDAEPMDAVNEDEAAMMAFMGFGGFDSTKASLYAQYAPFRLTLLFTRVSLL